MHNVIDFELTRDLRDLDEFEFNTFWLLAQTHGASDEELQHFEAEARRRSAARNGAQSPEVFEIIKGPIGQQLLGLT